MNLQMRFAIRDSKDGYGISEDAIERRYSDS